MHSFTEENIYDAAIIGGGPAGASAAYFLSEAGMKVILFEKQSLPRYKTCGGGIIQNVSSILPFGFNEVIENYCFKAEIYDHKARLNFSANRDAPIIMMVMREDFDNYLLSMAKAFGAKIMDETAVSDIDFLSDYVNVLTSANQIKTKFVLAADGAAGTVSQRIGVKNNVTKLPALEGEIHVNELDYEKYRKSARFDFDIIPFGYGWVFPKNHHLSVGVVRMKKGSENLHLMLEKYLEVLEINEIVKMEKHGFYIPINNGLKKFSTGRILLTGDAAALADPVTGEGISSAILSGKLAAEAIIEGNSEKSKVSKIYNEKIKTAIIKEHFYAGIISELVYTFPNIRKFLFKKYGKNLVEIMTDIITGKKMYSKIVTSPKNYMKLIKYFFRNNKAF